MCGENNYLSDIEIISEKVKTADNTNANVLNKCKEDKEYAKFVEEQQLKPFSGEIIHSNKHIKEENKDTIFNAVKSELSEFQNYFGNNIKLETFKDVKYELKNDDTDSEIQCIKEVNKVWFEIERTDPVILHGGDAIKSSQQFNVHLLISENTSISVTLVRHSEIVSKPFRRKRKNKNSVNPVIKVKHPRTLGIVEENECNTSEDCRTKLLVAQLINSSESHVEKVCILFDYYFSTFFEKQLYNLIDSLKNVITELLDSCERLSILSSHKITIEDFLLEDDSYKAVLQKYSKQFLETFCSIVDIFQEQHKKEMIPIIYLVLLTETITSVKVEDVRSIILKLLLLEHYNCEHDVIFSKNHVESQKMLTIYERWLEKYNTKHGKMFGSLNRIKKGSDFNFQSIECENTQPNGTIEARRIEVAEYSNAVLSVMSSFDVDDRKQTSKINSQCLDLQGSLQQDEETSKNFEYKESQGCTNVMCVYKQTERCCFCYDCCSCPNLCQVEDDQLFGDKYISCKEHKSIFAVWEEAHATEWGRVEKDHEMPYEPVCWRSNCGEKALIICVCKTRAYCGVTCRNEDWIDSHHETCSGCTDPSLFYSNTC